MKRVSVVVKKVKQRFALERRAEEEAIAAANARPGVEKLGGFRHGVLCREFLERGGHELTPAQALCFALLASHADEQGHCFPSRRLLAFGLGLSERSTSSALRVLRDRMLVEVVKRGYGQGELRTNRYQLRTPGSGWPSLTPIDRIKRSK